MSYEGSYTTVLIGESRQDSLDGYEILGEEFMDCCYWDDELKRQWYERLSPRGELTFRTFITGI